MKRSLALLLTGAMALSIYSAMPATMSAAASQQAVVKSGSIVAGVNFRDKPSLSGKVIGFLKKGTAVQVLDQSNKYFYKVKNTDGKIGYVSAAPKYIKVSGKTTASNGGTPSAPDVSLPADIKKQVDKVIQTGKQYMGTPYEFGSNRKTTATFDCSDFVKHIYNKALGINLPSDSRKQGAWIKDNSKAVYKKSDLKAGDLVFFMSYKGSSAAAYKGINKNSQRITHVAMYIGDGKLLHTYSVKSGGVRIDQFDGSWEHRFLFGGSVLK
ncbi:C40 family peptidase [Paenibacillus fonticola]|uniref:C40 family peptidase n=1 Tax=Paenibacillus fonticola TaxID=379896 RepID=UPI0003807316|nr:SH3 domain-containing C40 family peptidase [Paenibacillus fonticola]